MRRLVLLLVPLLLLAGACGSEEEATAPETGATATTAAVSDQEPSDVPSGAVGPGGKSAPASPCPGTDSPLVTDHEVYQPPEGPEPAARATFRDPVFGTCVVRATDRNADLAPGDTSAGLKNEYSRVQAFNADGTRLLVRGVDATWYLYDATTLLPLAELPFQGSVDPRWDASNPNLLHYIDGTMLYEYNVGGGQQRLIHDFARDFPGQSPNFVWTRYEGSPSRDGRWWGLMADDQDYLAADFLVYDMQEDRVTARLDLRDRSETERSPDTVTITPLGTYFTAFHEPCERGQTGTAEHPCGLMVWDRNLQNGRNLLRAIGHSDFGLDAQGREVLVYQDIDTDNISMLDLETGDVTALWPIDFSNTPIGLHISGRAFDLPGWFAVSTHDGDPKSYTWMDDVVFAMELKPGGRIVRLAHTQSLVDENQEHDYWAEPQVSVNPDFTRAVFTTNWGRSGTGEIEMYVIELPAGWSQQLE